MDERYSKPQPSVLKARGFTLVEMLVSIALLLVIMAMASSVFKITLQGSGRLQQLSEIDRSVRLFERQVRYELRNISTRHSVLAIQGNASPAWWTQKHKETDSDGDPTNDVSGSSGFGADPLRTNPTLGYDPLDGDGDRSFDGDPDDNDIRQMPRADVLMFVTNIQAQSYVFPDVAFTFGQGGLGASPVMVVYGHAELGRLSSDPRDFGRDIRFGFNAGGRYPGDATAGQFDNISFNDWETINGPNEYPLRRIPVLQDGGGADTRLGVQDVAQDWHLARRAVLLTNSFDPAFLQPPPGGPLVLPTGIDRYGHFLSPTDSAGNRCAGFLDQNDLSSCAVHPVEAHHLNWILGAEVDVVFRNYRHTAGQDTRLFYGDNNPAFPLTSGAGGAVVQPFNQTYEIDQRYFGGPGPLSPNTSLDICAADRFDAMGDEMPDGVIDAPGAVLVPAGNALMPADWVPPAPPCPPTGGFTGFYRGGLPAFWLARSHLDPQPPPHAAHRLGHYYMPNVASFKVEWTPNVIDPATGGDLIARAGLPEVLWIDPFKEPGGANRTGYTPPGAFQIPIDAITPSGVTKPAHLDEFEIMAQKLRSAPGTPAGFNLSVTHALSRAYAQLLPRFALSFDNGAGFSVVGPTQMNAYDINQDPSDGVQVGYNTHAWFSNDVLAGANPQTQIDTADPAWPKALRITVDLFDDAGTLEEPVRHVFIVPIDQN